MKKSFVNATHLEGYIYEHDLKLKESGEASKNPGTEFISGNLSIATDEEMLNVVQVHFTYTTALTSKGKPNTTFNFLKSIIDGKAGSVVEHGKENAARIRVDSAIGLNEWFDTRTEGNPLITVKRNEGGFVHQINPGELFSPAATFDADMVITNARRVEADVEKDLPEKMILKGYIFDFKSAIMPVEFSVLMPAAMDYFEGFEPTEKNPLFTKIGGNQISRTIVRTKEEKSAFGDVKVTETKSSQKDFVVNFAAEFPYEWDTPETITAAEMQKALADREVYLADMKRRNDEYQALKGRGNGAFTASKPASGAYDF